MGLFKSALQTLSEMAINESGLTLPETADATLLEDMQQTLANMTALTEQEMVFPAETVLVRKSERLGRYLVEMEDLSRYMLTNGVVNAKDAICNILEANGIDDAYYTDVAIVVDETSILDEMEDLGYNTPGTLTTPPKGLGLAMVGQQTDFSKIRRVANTKQLMDLLTGRYGLPLVKKNYKQEGFLEAAKQASEDVELKKKQGESVIHEQEPKKNNTAAKDNGVVEESADLDPYQIEVQRIKDIMAGKYDQF